MDDHPPVKYAIWYFTFFMPEGNVCMHMLPLNYTVLLKCSQQVGEILKGQLDVGVLWGRMI